MAVLSKDLIDSKLYFSVLPCKVSCRTVFTICPANCTFDVFNGI